MIIYNTQIKTNLFVNDEYNDRVYKYYSEESIKDNKYNQIQGNLSFVTPVKFNDPFDCNTLYKNSIDISDMFRVLCLTKDCRNILMWSYYASNHSGYCFGFDLNDIIKSVEKQKINGICIIGPVKYKKNRPDIVIKKNKFFFSDIKDYIDVTFTKYKEWKHEKEYRMVMISDDFRMNKEYAKEYISIQAPVKEYIYGCKSTKSIKGINKIIKEKRLCKDDEKYFLIERK